MKPPIKPKKFKFLLGHTYFYRKFIHYYSDKTFALEEILKEDKEYEWTKECDASFDTLKRKLVEAPILRF